MTGRSKGTVSTKKGSLYPLPHLQLKSQITLPLNEPKCSIPLLLQFFFEIFQGLPCYRMGVEGLSALLDNSYWVKYSLTNNKEDST